MTFIITVQTDGGDLRLEVVDNELVILDSNEECAAVLTKAQAQDLVLALQKAIGEFR